MNSSTKKTLCRKYVNPLNQIIMDNKLLPEVNKSLLGGNVLVQYTYSVSLVCTFPALPNAI